MRVIEYKYGDAPSLGPSVMALGLFDGVHLGHRELIRQAQDAARRLGASLSLFTFREGGRLKASVPRIYGEAEKCQIFERLGVDTVIFCDFPSVSQLSPEQFVTDVLIDALGAGCAVAGYNFRFGKGAAGDAACLTRLASEHGIDALICSEVRHGGREVSSTAIRELIAARRIREANELLGAPYFLSGGVKRGNGVGHTLGYPTVNTDIDPTRVVPPCGVYRTALTYKGRIYPALTNVGVCPTFNARPVHAETYILNFDGDLYGEKIDIYFLDYLRDEKAFSDIESLKMQINVDKNKVITENGDITWQELGLS